MIDSQDTFMDRFRSGRLRLDRAAISDRSKTWSLPRPARHVDIMLHAMAEMGKPLSPDAEKGFLTECGNFLRRRPALVVALKSGQVKNRSCLKGRQLTTDDLW